AQVNLYGAVAQSMWACLSDAIDQRREAAHRQHQTQQIEAAARGWLFAHRRAVGDSSTQEDRCQRESNHADRQVDGEDRVPVKGGRQKAAEGRAKGWRQQNRHANHRRGWATLRRWEDAIDDRERRREERATADAL